MNKQQFQKLFLDNVKRALSLAEKALGRNLSDDFTIELHGAGRSGELLSLREAVELLYLGEDCFYRIVDIGVKAVTKGKATIFVRISAHEPSKFEETWNTPKGNGPFKVLEPLTIHVQD